MVLPSNNPSVISGSRPELPLKILSGCAGTELVICCKPMSVSLTHSKRPGHISRGVKGRAEPFPRIDKPNLLFFLQLFFFAEILESYRPIC
jgi:hypothetical protein